MSSSIDLTGGAPVGVIINDDWTSADLGFNGSVDGINYFPLVDLEGNEIVVEAAEEDLLYALPMASLLSCKYLQLVSLDSSDGTPENQAEERAITVVILP